MADASSWKWKKRLSYLVIWLFMFFGGVEYAVVFPTMWENLQSLGATSSQVYMMGLCVSGVTMSDMFTGLVVGRIVDKTYRVASVVAVLNLFHIAGSVVYMCAWSPWILLLSRIVAGVGSACYVSFLTDVCRSSSVERRTSVLLMFNIAQQMGLLLGPACNLFLRRLDFHMGCCIHVGRLNAPGFFMMLAYILLEISIPLAYHNLSQGARAAAAHHDDWCQVVVPVKWSHYVAEMIRPEVLALIFLRFIGLFGQTCLETIVTPTMKAFFDYGDFENSLMYLAGGLVLILATVLLSCAASKISDRHLILFGMAVNLLAYVWLTYSMHSLRPGDPSSLTNLGIGMLLDLISIPIILDITMSLFSKLIRNEAQGFAHAVRRFFGCLALLLGPNWGGGALANPFLLFAVPIGLLLIAGVMFLLSYESMQLRPGPEHLRINESLPLLLTPAMT